jgi:hypothetical protein
VWARILRYIVLPAGAVLVTIQLVPYGWSHPNPPVTTPTPWPSPRVATLARAACYDCHSNETEWPAYSYVAPMSWLVRRDVERGRDALNFSTGEGEDGDDAAEVVADGSMPPMQYRLLHPDARLSNAEKADLMAALEQLDLDGDDHRGRRGRGGRG